MKIGPFLTAGTLAAALGACQMQTEPSEQASSGGNAAAQPGPGEANAANAGQQQEERQRQQLRDQARQAAGEIRFVVDKSDRKVRIFRGNELIKTHDVAVGDSEHETPSGEWKFDRVDLNPEWVPPDSEWAEDRERQPPGDPDNPMGRARLVFNMPYTIHGTDATNSLGKATSHGSIRVANENVIPLAELLLKTGGAWEGQDWFQQRIGNRKTEYQIKLPNPVPIKVQE